MPKRLLTDATATASNTLPGASAEPDSECMTTLTNEVVADLVSNLDSYFHLAFDERASIREFDITIAVLFSHRKVLGPMQRKCKY